LEPDFPFFNNENVDRRDAAEALRSQFPTAESFEDFCGSITSDVRRKHFLRTACFYLLLVQKGNWVVEYEHNDPVVEYLTNSYKIVGLFSLIESLSSERHEDFHGWLLKRKAPDLFPIQDRASLDALHEQYKETYGSIRRCVAFFERLPLARQTELRQAVQTDKTPIESIKKLAQFLHSIRSEFVHEARLALQVSQFEVWSLEKRGVVQTRLDIAQLMLAFEEGLVAYFRDET
jgi:hypothetical protein